MKTQSIKYLSIENTFDDFSISIMENFEVKKTFTKSISNNMYKTYGGIVPFLSYQEHLKNLPSLLSYFDIEDIENISFICYANKPGLKKNIALSRCLGKVLQIYIENKYFYSVPLFGVEHTKSHLLACLISEKYSIQDLNNSLFFLITGAHTSIFHIQIQDNVVNYITCIKTIDEAVGSLIDKIARMNNYINAADMCKKIENPFFIKDLSFPNMKMNPFFSFSGLYTHIKKIAPLYKREDFCFTIQKKIFDYLIMRMEKIKNALNIKKVFFAGGVVRNKFFNSMLNEKDYFFPDLEFCTDNASMIGINGYLTYKGWKIC